MSNHADKLKPTNRHRGAALVEMAIVIVLFLMVVFGILEFGRAIFEWSRLVESTRSGVRYAIVNDPACNIFGTPTDPGDPPYLFQACDNGPLDCDDGTQQTSFTLQGDCDAASDTGCGIVETMRAIQPLVSTGDVRVSYACTGLGYEDLAQKIPAVTVEALNVQYNFAVVGLLRLTSDRWSITMPSFNSTRTGEDLETVN